MQQIQSTGTNTTFLAQYYSSSKEWIVRNLDGETIGIVNAKDDVYNCVKKYCQKSFLNKNKSAATIYWNDSHYSW